MNDGTTIIAHTGESAHAYFERLKAERVAGAAGGEEGEEAFVLLETRLPLGSLPSTPKRIFRKAEAGGFTVEGYESRVQFFDTFFKTGEKQGELKKAAFEQRNIFLGGHVPGSLLRFHATWLGAKFSAHVWDPVGQYRYANSREKGERETYWMEKSSRSFERWLADWAEILGEAKAKEAA